MVLLRVIARKVPTLPDPCWQVRQQMLERLLGNPNKAWTEQPSADDIGNGLSDESVSDECRFTQIARALTTF